MTDGTTSRGRTNRSIPSSWWLGGAGSAAAIAGVGLLGSAAAVRGEFIDTSDRSEAEALATRNHVLALTGTGLFVAGGGLVTGALLVGEW